jgi:hypothetical protein
MGKGSRIPPLARSATTFGETPRSANEVDDVAMDAVGERAASVGRGSVFELRDNRRKGLRCVK